MASKRSNIWKLVCWVSLSDPFAIVRIKTLGAGIVNTALGLIVDGRHGLPMKHVGVALLLGSLSYGASVVLDAYALRWVGAAREAAYFATAPFVGAVISVAWLGEPLHRADAVAIAAMSLGVVFLLRERHGHIHTHGPLEHEHLHLHDEHHQHGHGPGDPSGEPHSHQHRHAQLTHDHPHVSDAHHRHKH